ncbi:hypothetical protein OOU_Y34scaffold00915g1, partial [Pyricularia oryzae Y34]
SKITPSKAGMDQEILDLYIEAHQKSRETIFPGSRAWDQNFGGQLLPAAEPPEVQTKLQGGSILTQAKNGETKHGKPTLGTRVPAIFSKRRINTIYEEPRDSPVSTNGAAAISSKQGNTASIRPANGPEETLFESYQDKYRDVFQLKYGNSDYITVAQKISPMRAGQH